MKKRLLAHVGLPLLIGGMIYVCFRDPSLLLFDWLNQIGLGPLVLGIRSVTLPFADQFPRWLLYSLPDALWVYAAIMFMDCIWSGHKTRVLNRRLWLWSGPLLAAAIELGQLTGVVPGSFDPYDLILSAVATSIAALIIINASKSRSRAEKGTKYVQTNENELVIAGRA